MLRETYPDLYAGNGCSLKDGSWMVLKGIPVASLQDEDDCASLPSLVVKGL